jgi:acetolactate synthase I/II/III large subunit
MYTATALWTHAREELDIDFTALAVGLGDPASRATTAAELASQLSGATAEPGPHLIEAVLPSIG